jgi:hypothetical protein
MMMTEMDIETSVYYAHLTRLIAREDFIKLYVKCWTIYRLSERNDHYFIHSFWIITLASSQTARKYFNIIRRIVVGMSDTLNGSSNCLQKDLRTSIRTEHCAKHLVTRLKRHKKTVNLLAARISVELKSEFKECDLPDSDVFHVSKIPLGFTYKSSSNFPTSNRKWKLGLLCIKFTFVAHKWGVLWQCGRLKGKGFAWV